MDDNSQKHWDIASLDEVMDWLSGILRGEPEANLREQLKAAETLIRYHSSAQEDAAAGPQIPVIIDNADALTD